MESRDNIHLLWSKFHCFSIYVMLEVDDVKDGYTLESSRCSLSLPSWNRRKECVKAFCVSYLKITVSFSTLEKKADRVLSDVETASSCR